MKNKCGNVALPCLRSGGRGLDVFVKGRALRVCEAYPIEGLQPSRSPSPASSPATGMNGSLDHAFSCQGQSSRPLARPRSVLSFDFCFPIVASTTMREDPCHQWLLVAQRSIPQLCQPRHLYNGQKSQPLQKSEAWLPGVCASCPRDFSYRASWWTRSCRGLNLCKCSLTMQDRRRADQ